MNISVLIVIFSVVVVTNCAGAPPTKGYYNRRNFPPPNYYYGHKGGFNAGPPIHKYRPPGFRGTRNPYIGPSPGQGIHHQVQGVPQSVVHQSPPQTLHQGSNQGPQQVLHQGQPQVPHQGQPQVHHQGQHQAHYQGQPQVFQQGPQIILHQVSQQGFQQGSQQVLHQGQQPVFNQGQQPVFNQGQQAVFNQGTQQHQVPHQALHQGQTQIIHQGQVQGPHQGQAQVLLQRVPQNVHQVPLGGHQGIPSSNSQGVTQFVRQNPPQGHQHGSPQDLQQGAYHSLVQASSHPGNPYQQASQQSQIFQSLPPKRLTPTPPVFSKTQVIPQFTAVPFKNQHPSHLNSLRDSVIEASFTAATKSYYKPNNERSPIHTIPAPNLSLADKPADFEARIQQQAAEQQYPTTPRFKTLNKAVADQIKNNPNEYLSQQAQIQFAPDPDPQNNQVNVPPSNDPFSQPSNGQLPIDIYLQKQLDNEIAKQENLYHQQQKEQEARQYQQQLEEAQQLAVQEQAFQLHQESLQQQLYQQQALEAQQQLALQAQQHAALQQQALLQQQQQYQQVSPQQQAPESLTAEELFKLMNGISPSNEPNNQPSTQSVQDVLAKPQNQNEISSAATTNFQPNYQSFNYNEKEEQERQEDQKDSAEKSIEAKRSTSEITKTKMNPQYQNFNYDEKTKPNGFNNENSHGVQQSYTQSHKAEQTTSTVEFSDIKKEKRYQKHAFAANPSLTAGYSTLPKEVTESILQGQYNHQQSGYSTLPVNYNEKNKLRKLKPDNIVANEIKKHHLKKKNRLPNNGYSTIAEDLLQQHDLQNDLQHLTYSTLPNKKIIEVLKQKIQSNATQQTRSQQPVTTEKNNLQKIRESAQKFYNPHILQAVRNNTSNDNVQIQQSIQIYENNYASKGDDNHIDLSGITTTSTTTAATSTVSSSSEPTIVTEINVIENNSNNDSDHQESNLYEEIMLQDESKPLEDTYNSNSHSYFGQRIRPKRT